MTRRKAVKRQLKGHCCLFQLWITLREQQWWVLNAPGCLKLLNDFPRYWFKCGVNLRIYWSVLKVNKDVKKDEWMQAKTPSVVKYWEFPVKGPKKAMKNLPIWALMRCNQHRIFLLASIQQVDISFSYLNRCLRHRKLALLV